MSLFTTRSKLSIKPTLLSFEGVFRSSRRLNILIWAVMALLLFSGSASAQFYFGKNKVQYTDFDWQVMTTDHFKIYFYTDESDLAAIAARYAEDSYRTLAEKFNHEVSKKIPLIIYSSPGYFSQTNVIPDLIPESVGGFTEFMKGRVVVPFYGPLADFKHVIQHELVHVFTLSKLDWATERRSQIRFSYPPLWFTEGLAEYWSKKWDTQADMIIKDMVINGHLFTIPNLYQIQGTFFMYKLGESICGFIDSEYGSDKLTLLFDNWSKGKTFEDVVETTLGDNLLEVSRKWEYSLKKKYYPELDSLGLPEMESSKLTGSGFNVKAVPIRWDNGDGLKDWIVYKANRLGYSGLYMKPADHANKQVVTLLKGERSSKYESLYLLRSGIDANDSGLVVFSSKSKERDVIYLYDIRKRKVTRRFEFNELVAIRSPRFSPDARQVVFTGFKKNGFADLYLLDLETEKYRRLTHDIYYDIDPVFSLDGSSVIFTSDRCSGGDKGAENLFRMSLEDGNTTQLTFGDYIDETPEPTGRGIYFSSNRAGTFNLFLLDSAGTLTKQSTFATGAFNPRVSSDGHHLIYTGYQNLDFQIYKMKMPKAPEPVVQPVATEAPAWKPPTIASNYRQASIKYRTNYSFDIAQSSVGYDPVYGSIGGLQVALSDVLGNHAVYFLLTNTATTKDDLLKSFNFGMTYINREHRLNWGAGIFHLYDEYYNDYDGYYYERQAGGISLFSYPISKFHRVDFTTIARYSKKDRLYGLKSREKFLVTNYVSWIYDNSLWDISGPIDGRRYNISVGITSSLNDMRSYSRQFSIDLRHYFRLGRFSAFANRLFAYASSGLEPQRIYFGGSWSFRGFDRRAFYNRNILFASNELRFPLIDHLLIGFPIGGLGFSAIRGALFYDTGAAWDDEFDQFLGSIGAGFRVNLAYLVVLRFDFSRITDYHTISPHTHFNFFFGWNF